MLEIDDRGNPSAPTTVSMARPLDPVKAALAWFLQGFCPLLAFIVRQRSAWRSFQSASARPPAWKLTRRFSLLTWAGSFCVLLLLQPLPVAATHSDGDAAHCPDTHNYGDLTLDYFLSDYRTKAPLAEGLIYPPGTWIQIDARATATGSCNYSIYDYGTKQCINYFKLQTINNIAASMFAETNTSTNGWYYPGRIFGLAPNGSTAFYQVLDSRDRSTSTGPISILFSYPGSYAVYITSITNTTSCNLVPKSLGKSFTVSIRNPFSDKDLGCSENNVGNPCNPATGNKYERAEDYFSPTLSFVRHYNSKLEFDAGLGFGWTSSAHQALELYKDGRIWARQADGSATPFVRAADGSWKADADGKLTLTQDETGYSLRLADNRIQRYDLTRKLIWETAPTGTRTDLEYDQNGRVSRIVGPFGATLGLAYGANGRLATLTDPSGRTVSYSYDTYDNLTTVQYPDGTKKSYLYENTSKRHLLTGIVDEKGIRYATFAYDTSGRVSSSEHAGGAVRVNLVYNTNGTTTVTDALGTARLYTFKDVGGRKKIAGLSKPCDSCSSNFANATYDTSGNITSRTDFNGNKTCYGYDLSRNLETVRVEGVAASDDCAQILLTPPADTRVINTQWHPEWRTPTRVAGPNKITTYTFNGQEGTTCAPPGSSTVLACSKTEQATSDNNGAQAFDSVPTGAPRTWGYSYDSLGRLLSVDGPRTDVPDITTYTYYEQSDICIGCRGNLKSVTNAAGHVSTYTRYNTDGLPEEVVDANGLATTIGYDSRGRLASLARGAEITQYSYEPSGALAQVTLPDASHFTYEYDAAHRLTGIKDALGNRMGDTLDALGNRVKEDVFDPQGQLQQTRSRVIDALNRVQREIGGADPLNQVIDYTYDGNGNTTLITQPYGRTIASSFDALNRRREVVDAANGKTSYAYSGQNVVTQVTDPAGLATNYVADGLGNMTRLDSPDTATTDSSHDEAGNLRMRIDARGSVSALDYDVLNRVTALRPSDGMNIYYTYDQGPFAMGRLTEMRDTAVTHWTYDPQGRVTSKSQAMDGIALSSQLQYDAAGRLTRRIYPSGLTVDYSYENGRISRILVNGTPLLDAITYRPFGPVQGWVWNNGQSYQRGFDLDGRITSYPRSTSTQTLSYDAANRITALSDSANPQFNMTFEYDLQDRITRAALGTGPSQLFNYDTVGNRLSLSEDFSTTTYSYGTSNHRLNSVSGASTRTFNHDPAGNLISDGQRFYGYDGRGRLQQVMGATETTNYSVNGLGQRTRKARADSTTYFFYSEDGKLAGEYDRSGMVIEEFIWLDELPVAVAMGSRVYRVYPDHLGTPRDVLDPSSNVAVWRWENIDPFGKNPANRDPDYDGVSFEFNLRLPGQYYDAETGLHYNYFRDYDPLTGRYLQSDPIGLAGGINTYSYVGGNPLSRTDPRGLSPDNPPICNGTDCVDPPFDLSNDGPTPAPGAANQKPLPSPDSAGRYNICEGKPVEKMCKLAVDWACSCAGYLCCYFEKVGCIGRSNGDPVEMARCEAKALLCLNGVSKQ